MRTPWFTKRQFPQFANKETGQEWSSYNNGAKAKFWVSYRNKQTKNTRILKVWFKNETCLRM